MRNLSNVPNAQYLFERMSRLIDIYGEDNSQNQIRAFGVCTANHGEIHARLDLTSGEVELRKKDDCDGGFIRFERDGTPGSRSQEVLKRAGEVWSEVETALGDPTAIIYGVAVRDNKPPTSVHPQ